MARGYISQGHLDSLDGGATLKSTAHVPPLATPPTSAKRADPVARSAPPRKPPNTRAGRSSTADTRTRSVAESTGEGVPADVVERMKDPDYCFEKFVLVDELGKGGMGVVWKAWQRDLKRWVAIKFLSADDEDELQRFWREAQTAARLSHPNIGGIFDLGETAGKHYIVMEFIDGPSVHEMGKLNWKRAAEIFRDAALALHHAHQEGVIHRDIKPHNLMVSRTGRTYVMDFGLAKAVRSEEGMTVPGMILGTPSFMSPEQAEGRLDRVDRRSDVYSLAASLYAAIAGKPPFPGRTPVDIMYKVVHSVPPPFRGANPDIPPDLEAVILRSLSKAPADRHPSAKAFAEDLEKVLRGEPLSGRRPSPAPWKNPYVLAGSAGVLVVGLVAALAFRSGPPPAPVPTATEAPGAKRLEAKSRARPAVDRAQRHLDAARQVLSADGETWDALASRTRDAIAAADEALAMLPDHEDALLAKGRALALVEDYEGAAACFEAATKADPRFSLAEREWGLALLGRAEFLQREVRRQPKPGRKPDAEVQALVTRAHERLQRYVDLAQDPAEARFARAVAAFAQGDHALAAKSLGELARENPTPEVLFLKGRAQRAAGQVSEAIETLHDLLRRQRNHYPGLRLLSLCYMKGRMAKDAVDILTRMAVFRPRETWALRLRAPRKVELGDTAGGLADVEAAIALEPRSADCWSARGYVNLNIGRIEEAIADFTKALSLDPKSSYAYQLRGTAYTRLKREAEALADADAGVKLDPANEDFHNIRGVALVALKRPEEAIEAFREAVRLDPSFFLASANLVKVLTTVKRDAEAGAEMTRVGGLEPGPDPEWQTFWELCYDFRQYEPLLTILDKFIARAVPLTGIQFWRGRCLYQLKRYPEAVQAYDAHMKSGAPVTWDALNEASLCQYQVGKYDEALRLMDASIERAPKQPIPWKNKGAILYRLKRYQESVAAFRKAIELDPSLAPEIQKDLDRALEQGN